MRFGSIAEVRQAYDQGIARPPRQDQVRLATPTFDGKQQAGEMIETTVGRALFNEIVPEGVGYINEVLTKKNLRGIIGGVFKATELPEDGRVPGRRQGPRLQPGHDAAG